MSTVLLDTFTDTDPTLLTDHNADSGQPWASATSFGSGNGTADEFVVRGNRLRRVNWDDGFGYNGGGEALAYPVGIAGMHTLPAFTVTFGLLFATGVTNSTLYLYQEADGAPTNDDIMVRLTNGINTFDLGNNPSVAITFNTNQLYAIRLEVAGSTADLYVDEVLVGSYTGPWGVNAVPTGAFGLDLFDTGAESYLTVDTLLISAGATPDFWTNRVKTTEIV